MRSKSSWIASRVGKLSGEGALAVFARAHELESEGRSIIHLELGEPDFHPGPEVVQAAKDALDAGKDRYAAVAGVPVLRQAIADYLHRTRNVNVDASHVIVGPGCKIMLFLALMAVVDEGDEVLYPNPCFPAYASVTRGLGGVPVPFSLLERNRFQPDLDEIAALITPRTKVLMTNSPSNPTGTVYKDEVQRGLADLAIKHDLVVLSDEIYARIIYGGTYKSMISYPGMAERTVIIDGFSKSFGMTGWRLGFAVAPPQVFSALHMLAINSFTCVNEFAQYGAVQALEDRAGTTPRMVQEFARRREQFIAGLNRIPGFHCIPPEGAFYAWVNISDTGLSAEQVCHIMLEEGGVAANPGAAFGSAGKDFVRFSFASSSALLQQAVERIQKVSSAWSARTRKPELAGKPS